MSDTYEEMDTQLEVLWTVEQVANYLSLKKMTIYRWIAKGKIKHKKIGKSVRIPRSEIERIAGEAQEKLQP